MYNVDCFQKHNGHDSDFFNLLYVCENYIAEKLIDYSDTDREIISTKIAVRVYEYLLHNKEKRKLSSILDRFFSIYQIRNIQKVEIEGDYDFEFNYDKYTIKACVNYVRGELLRLRSYNDPVINACLYLLFNDDYLGQYIESKYILFHEELKSNIKYFLQTGEKIAIQQF